MHPQSLARILCIGLILEVLGKVDAEQSAPWKVGIGQGHSGVSEVSEQTDSEPGLPRSPEGFSSTGKTLTQKLFYHNKGDA